MSAALDLFSSTGQIWFQEAFGAPTEVQEKGWPQIAAGKHTLLCAPTGSGKTLAAFYWCLDRLLLEPGSDSPKRSLLLYVSPLKALALDIDRNLRGPLTGLSIAAARGGVVAPAISVAVRTGDTSSEERRKMQRNPPDILITTPESLFLLLTSASRAILDSVRWVIVDEIHTMAATKRGAHLAVSLERLCHGMAEEPQRIGLSATQRPLGEVARYLGGRDRQVSIVDAGRTKTLQLGIEVPVDDMSQLGQVKGADTDSTSVVATRPIRDVGITTEIAHARRWATPDGGARGRSGMPPDRVTQKSPATSLRSIWPAIYPRILDLVRAHRSTIIFVNSRRMAERLAAKLNELAGEELVRAHHGSIAREQRLIVEDLLKAGELPALVATSSLELGIDMGAVDLVVQVGSPGSVARGIQRIGRAGHSVGEPSSGTILPTYRGDLLECAAVAERMLVGEIESTRVPRSPIDVLAQQIVAMCALDTWQVQDLRETIQRAYPFAELGDRSFNATLDMLDGRYPSQEFSGLQARIVWDRMNGSVRGRQGAQRLAVTSGGTIPDRGLFTVNLVDEGKRVGELDEEMVYELRPGETFVLGATAWKVMEITHSQVLVVPAPGEPGKITFWHGDAVGRPAEVGRAVGALSRELLGCDESEALRRLEHECCCDSSAAENLLAYLKDQREAAGAVSDDRTIIIERFRDQLGDWRICVLTPFGSSVHSPWVLAVQARLQERLGLEIQSISSDDGFALRLMDSELLPQASDLLLEPEEVQEAVTSQLHGSALFASRFRENAARALLLPRLRPASRTPLWLQRQRSADLLQVAARFPDFPIIAETYRECLLDVFDLEALSELMTRVRSREVRVVEVETAVPSPFSSSLLFDYVAQYMYEGDTPMAERRAQALTLDRELLAELLGSEDLRELLDPEVIVQTELELQGLDERRWPRDVDEALDVLRSVGDLTEPEAAARGIKVEWLKELSEARRSLRLRIGSEERWAASDDAWLYRDALGVSLPMGLPEAFVEGHERPMEGLLTRWANTHTPFTAADPARRWKVPPGVIEANLEQLLENKVLIVGRFRPGSHEREFCSAEVLRMIRRRSLAALRHEIEPVSATVLSRFLPEWQGVGSQAGGLDRLADVIAQLQGYSVPVSVLERDVLSARLSGYSPQLLDQLVASGEVVWIGKGSLGVNDGRIALYLRKDVASLVGSPAASLVESAAARENDEARADESRLELRDELCRRLASGACFFADLLAMPGRHTSEEVLDELWNLVWSGVVTNDTYAPLRFIGPGRRTSRGRLTRLGPPRSLGRWSLVRHLLWEQVPSTKRSLATCDVLLQRYGIVTREQVVSEGVPGGFVGIYPVLRSMEESGRIRRGYFVEGLGGAQFALPGAVDRLRDRHSETSQIIGLAATDPACAYGVTLAWPDLAGRAARAAGAHVILDSGELRIYVERGGRSLLTQGDICQEHVETLNLIAERHGKLEVRTVDGTPVGESTLNPLLIESGFKPTHRGLVFYPETTRKSA